jgi:hypothetical protein
MKRLLGLVSAGVLVALTSGEAAALGCFFHEDWDPFPDLRYWRGLGNEHSGPFGPSRNPWTYQGMGDLGFERNGDWIQDATDYGLTGSLGGPLHDEWVIQSNVFAAGHEPDDTDDSTTLGLSGQLGFQVDRYALALDAGYANTDFDNLDVDAWWFGVQARCFLGPWSFGASTGLGNVDNGSSDSGVFYASTQASYFPSPTVQVTGNAYYGEIRDFDREIFWIGGSVDWQPDPTLPVSVGATAGYTYYRWPGWTDDTFNVGLRLRVFGLSQEFGRHPADEPPVTLYDVDRGVSFEAVPRAFRYQQ